MHHKASLRDEAPTNWAFLSLSSGLVWGNGAQGLVDGVSTRTRDWAGKPLETLPQAAAGFPPHKGARAVVARQPEEGFQASAGPLGMWKALEPND